MYQSRAIKQTATFTVATPLLRVTRVNTNCAMAMTPEETVSVCSSNDADDTQHPTATHPTETHADANTNSNAKKRRKARKPTPVPVKEEPAEERPTQTKKPKKKKRDSNYQPIQVMSILKMLLRS